MRRLWRLFALTVFAGLMLGPAAEAQVQDAQGQGMTPVPIAGAGDPGSIRGPAIATEEQAYRWLSANGAHERAYDWVDLAWGWGEAVGVRPDLMLAQEMFETGWGHYGGVVTPDHHNVAGIKIGDPSAGDEPEGHERFGSWSEGVRAHANHLAAYCGARPVSAPGDEPIHARYYVVTGSPWAGTVETTDGLSTRWSPRSDYARVLHEDFLDPLRES